MPTDHRGLRVALLGPVLVEGRDGVLAEPVGVLGKALVVALAETDGHGVGRTHGVEAIVESVWGDQPPRNARPALQTLVSRVRATCADGLVASRPGGYALALAPEQTDVGMARDLGRRAAAHAADGDHAAAIGCLDEALALWRGEPGVDLGDTPAATELAEASAALSLDLRELRARCLLDAGDAAAALAEAEPLAAGHPLDERLQLTHLRALAATGRRTDAIAAFASYRAALRDELGISPGPALVTLNAELLRADGEGEASAPPERPATRPARTRIGLKAAPNPLIGRDDDVHRVESLLAQHRLVTILGTGGLGKTRLAQEVAARAAAPVVVFTELASIRSDDDVPLALGSTLGIREATTTGARLAELGRRSDLRERIVDQLGERPTLLVVDNCEQIVDGAATWVADLLGAVPSLTVLATSRSPLEIGAERVYRLDPLASEGDEGVATSVGPAVQLFVERAQAARPGAALPPEPIARLCRRLDGLPLAIELAAARIRSMSVEQIEDRLGDRFALLAGGDRSAPERQRTLLAVIEWSWALLTPAEQRALPRLAWFVDGFALDAAETVLGEALAETVLGEASDAISILDGLIAQSLLSVAEDATGRPRYRMLETVREFGQSRLAEPERAAALDALDVWARAFAAERTATARGPRQLESFALTAIEQDNLVAVLRRAIARRDATTVVTVFACLAYFWTVRGAHAEIAAFGGGVLEATRGYRPEPSESGAAMLADTLIAGTSLATFSMTGLRALARVRATRRLDLPMPSWLAAMGDFLLALPDLDEAKRRMDEMVESPDPDAALIATILRTQFAENAGDPVSARRDAIRGHALAAEVGDAWAASTTAMLVAQLASQTGDADETLRWAGVARTSFIDLGADEDLWQVDWTVATALLSSGRLDEADAALHAVADAAPTARDGAELAMMADLALAELARVRGDDDEALAIANRVVDGAAALRLRTSPWFQLTLAALVAGGTQSGWPDEVLTPWAELLRRRTDAMLRARPDLVDRPVLGTAAAGWSAWASGHPSLANRAAELLALAGALQSRQDLPALRRDAIERVVAARVGADRVRAAHERVGAMTPAEQTERTRALMAESVPAAPEE